MTAERESKPSGDAVAASAGRLRKRLFVVTSTAVAGFAPLKEHLADHLAYLRTLEDAGKLFLGGPLFDDDPERWSGDGLLVYAAADAEEARAITEADPLHRSGARTFSIRAWLVNDGSLTLTVRLSDQRGAVGG
jgi:uncharacterized protein